MSVGVLYWDTSAILSALLLDSHTADARRWLSSAAVNLVSSLAQAEFHACLARLQREAQMSVGAADATVAALNSGRWRRVTTGPDPSLLRSLALRSQLRGADLWHLALAATLRVDLLELRLLTFDARMQRAAVSEGVSI